MVHNKLYIVVREDLSIGAQMAQSLHAFREFLELHPELERTWYKESNTIVVLAAQDESHLNDICFHANNKQIKHAKFFEPDFENALTAIAFEPSVDTKDLLSKLKLAGS